MKVLLVGLADSIFFEHFTKTIKKIRKDISFDVYSIYEICGNYDLSACDNVFENKWAGSKITKTKGIGALIFPFLTWMTLSAFLKRQKKYDIVHFKWLVPAVVLLNLRKILNQQIVIATFWGREYNRQKLLYSNRCFRFFLKKFLRNVDWIVNNEASLQELNNSLNTNYTNVQYAHYGSSIYKEIKELIKNESKQVSKKNLNINSEQITVSIGYSGKAVHQHKLILNTLFGASDLKKRLSDFVFILPFTHGASEKYYEEVIAILEQHQANYIRLSKKMTDFEVAQLRNATDIMIQLSESDGRSASIIESVLTGNILIAGSWLPYQFLHDKSIYFHELDSIDQSLPTLLVNLANNLTSELTKCNDNAEKMGFETWDRMAVNWIKAYDVALSHKRI